MGRQQDKNTVSNIKNKTALSETSGSTTARQEHSNANSRRKWPEKNFMKTMETLKEEMKKSLQEMEKNTTKKIGRNQQIP